MPDVPDYFNRVNQDLLALIPPDAKTVLEIGCGAGALCEAYRKMNPGVVWLGVESNQDAADVAREDGRLNDAANNDSRRHGPHCCFLEVIGLYLADCLVLVTSLST